MDQSPKDRIFNRGTELRVELSAGPVHYESYGEGPPVVFVHGAFVDGTLWAEAARLLAVDHRCIVPTWPLGSHTEPMHADAQITPTAVAGLVIEFLERLDLEQVTLVGNDSGGAVCQLVAVEGSARVERIVLTNCDAFEVFPPKAFEYFKVVPRIPGLLTLLSKELHTLTPLARAPTAFGALSRKRIPTATLKRWLRPAAKDAGIRRDLAKLLRSIDNRITLEAGERLGEFEGEVLLVWGEADKHFPIELGERLTNAFRKARLVRLSEASTFVSLDEPDRLASEIRAFLAEGVPAARRPALERSA